jgi:hypothetical protein
MGMDSPMGSGGLPLMTTKLPFSKGSSSQSLLSGQIVRREGLLCSYLYKMVDETIYYTIPYGISRYDWKPIGFDDVFKFYGKFSIYRK